MKQITVGLFVNREDAEKAINQIHNSLGVDTDHISYIYRNTDGEVREVDADDVSSSTPGEGAKSGAVIGGTVGAIAGIATVAGLIPVIGPIFAAGPLAAALGLTGALGTTAAGAATGAVAGGVIGALTNMGIGEERAQRYADRVRAGDVLVSTHADTDKDVASLLTECGATDVEVYRVTP